MTTTEMKTQVNYPSWDFTSTWGINSAINSGYLYLISNHLTTIIYLDLIPSGSSVYGSTPTYTLYTGSGTPTSGTYVFDTSPDYTLGTLITDASPMGTITWSPVLTSASNVGTYNITYGSGITVASKYALLAGNAASWMVTAVPAPPPPPPNISTGSSTTISNLGSYTPVLSGGTLVLNKDDSTSTALTIASDGGTIQNPTTGSATLSGALSGSGGLTFTGVGTTVLTGANTYTGGTTVASGTLQGNTNSLQGSVTNNGTVVFDQATTGTFTGSITGTGKLVTQNTGTLVLTGSNTYSGGTTVNSGSTLSISSGSALGTGRLDLVSSSNASATLTTTGDTIITNDITLSGN